ncbi:MAG: ABC transporter ATP-binding protein [Euryarchaeota archaeon]|nr:ABC transporter ATP-binding protein [Euryarchaeota archaeon]
MPPPDEKDTPESTEAHASGDLVLEETTAAEEPEGPDGIPGDDDSTTEEVAEGAGNPPLARFYGLSRSYDGKRALGPLDLTIERGTVGLLGPNGAGKSTLIRLMMGVLQPTEGRLEVLGKDPSSLELRRHIGYAPEGPALFPGLSGVQAVAYAGRLVGMQSADALQRAHLVLDYVELGEARYRLVEGYSTGMRQRLKLAQALVHDPELLILDEPTEGVDPKAREDLLQLIHELSRDHDIQLLLSTHLLHDVERVASHAMILNRGRVIENGPIAELRTAHARGHQVRIAGPIEPLMARLAADNIAHEWRPPALRVQLDDPYRLLQYVQESGAVIRQIAPIELSLDEVFEEAVRRPYIPEVDLAPGTTEDPTLEEGGETHG